MAKDCPDRRYPSRRRSPALASGNASKPQSELPGKPARSLDIRFFPKEPNLGRRAGSQPIEIPTTLVAGRCCLAGGTPSEATADSLNRSYFRCSVLESAESRVVKRLGQGRVRVNRPFDVLEL